MATGLSDPAAINSSLTTLADVAPDITTGVGALRGQQQDQDLRRLVANTATTVKLLGTPSRELRGLVSGAAATLQTTAARDQDVRSILDQGPLVTRTTTQTLARVDGTLAKADRLIRNVRTSADKVAPTLARLRPALVSTGTLLTKARPLARDLRPTVSSLAATAHTGVPLLNELQPSIDRIDKTILPYLGREDPGTGKSTTVMIGGTAAGFGGAASQMDLLGHFIRFPALGGTKTAYLPCKTSLADPAAASFLACDSLETALKTYLQYVPPLLTTPAAKAKDKP
jgi:ABC-type transporter Mla subunit MlaD